MRIFSILFLFYLSLYAGESLNKKWESSKNCIPCHKDITNRWTLSRHANSHFSKNDLFKKTILYIVKKKPTIILDEIKIECAKCHNPRVTKSSISNSDKLSLLVGHASVQNAYTEALNTKNMRDGINCLVCHNVDQIHFNEKVGSDGYKSVSFGEQGTMFGPFKDAISPYHKTEHRNYFSDDNPKLCFACHYSAKNYQGVEIYTTGKEYKSSANKTGKEEGCKECHMSKKKQGVASNYSKAGEKPRMRMVREHRFASVDNSDILNTYIDISNTIKNNQFIITLKNNTPHNLPTGYGLREILLTVNYFDSNDKKINSSTFTLGVKWKDENGKITIPHLAYSIIKDTRLAGKSRKAYHFTIPDNTKYLKYIFSYKFINSTLAQEINVKDKFFLKEYIFLEKKVHL